MRIFAQKALLASMLFLTAAPAWARPEEDAAGQAVESFYAVYVGKVNDFIEKRIADTPPEKTWAPFFTKGLYAAYRKVMQTPDLDYDPILQSNNLPDGMTPIKTRVEGDTAWISAKYAGYIETTKPLELRLKKRDGKWLLDAIGPLNK